MDQMKIKNKNLKYIPINEMSKNNTSFCKFFQYQKIKPSTSNRNTNPVTQRFQTPFKENSHYSNFKIMSPSKTFFTSNTIDTNYTNRTNNKTKSFIKLLSPLNQKSKIDEKIFIANENKKQLLKQKKENILEKYQERNKKIQKIREKIQKKKIFISNKINKLNDMRRLRLKIHNILSNQGTNLCDEFESKNSAFNIKMFDYLSGKHNLNQSIKYQSKFRFDKIDNGEGHDRYKMLIDVDTMKQNEEMSDKILENELSLNERKLIIEDPDYFFHNNVSDKFKSISLVQRINQEENSGRKNNFNFLPFLNKNLTDTNQKPKSRNLKEKLSNRIRTDVSKRLNDIKNDINKTIYLKRTKDLNFKTDEIIKEHKDKIFKTMIDSLSRIFHQTLKKEMNDNKDKREKMYEILNPNNFQYRRKRQSTFDYTNDKTKFTFDTFNKDEIELLKSFKKQIKDSYG